MSVIREDIISALKTRLETINGSNGYLTTLDTVEIGYRDPSKVGPGERPYIGIVPGAEQYNDEPGRVVTQWRIALACYTTPAAATLASVSASLSNLTRDVRRALYASPQNLNVDQVILARVTSREGTEGLIESALKRDASMLLWTTVKFWEEATE